MLAELRKFGATFALATQTLAYLDELDRALRPTVMANVDQLFCYAMSAEDARIVERELDGLVTTSDLIALDDFHCYARLTVEGQRVPVFSLALDPPTLLADEQRTQAEALRQRSQRRIGREAQRTETLIAHAALRRKALTALAPTASRQKTESSLPSNPTMGVAHSAAMQGGTNMKPPKQPGPREKAVQMGWSAPQDSEAPINTAAPRQLNKARRRRPRRSKIPPFTSLLLDDQPINRTVESNVKGVDTSNDTHDYGDSGNSEAGDESEGPESDL